MTDKLEALKAAALAATPGPWYRSSVMFNGITSEQTFVTQGNKPHIANASEKRDAIFIAAASPDVVLSLLAALEEKDQQIAHQKICLYNEIKSNAWAFNRIRELEQRLQKPIKLPDEIFIKISGQAVAVMGATAVKERIRAAGFNVKDETIYACPTCGEQSYEDLGGGGLRCCDCGEYFEKVKGE
ncbi:ead/Ea22-like family protein [Serratia fonticola]|uniref:ead/Ea22-like family protein n=1 Tax=Serratia fonticola TaxID=47917 RepID=UPI0016485665|nr:ead/Ea22-like family protein [Serratia fonticola]MBC3250498.1 ead/Ea22-like family protein [Serratia fonticola]